MTKLTTLALIAALGATAAGPALAQYDDPRAAAEKAVREEMAKAQKAKIRNDEIVAKQRAAEKPSKEKASNPASGDGTRGASGDATRASGDSSKAK